MLSSTHHQFFTIIFERNFFCRNPVNPLKGFKGLRKCHNEQKTQKDMQKTKQPFITK